MSFKLVPLMALLVALGTPCAAEEPTSGSTEYRAQRGDSLPAIRARPLAALGKDAIRFSSVPSLGGFTVIIEVSRADKNWALGHVYFLAGHQASQWRQTGKMRIFMPAAEFESLALSVDTLTARFRAEMAKPPPPDTVRVCADGDVHIVEQRSNGKPSWIRKACSGANDPVAREMARLLGNNVNRYLQRLGDTLP